MANLQVKDGAAATKYLKTSGAGTDLDPHITEHLESNSADALTALAAIQAAVEAGATETTIDTVVTALADLLTELNTKASLTDTQPISAASLPLPAGASTAANQSTGNTALASLLTELQAKADLAETQPVSAASLPLPTGASTAANQTTGNTSLATIATNTTGVATAANQATANASLATITGHVDAVETKLDTVNTNLTTIDGRVDGLETSTTSIDTKTPALGQAAMAASTPVAIASNQSSIPVAASLQAGTNNIGDVDVLSLPALPTGTNNIGDVDVLTLPNITIGARSAPSTAVTSRASINIASSGDNTIVAAVGGQTVRIHKLFLIASGAVNLKFKDGASTDLTPALPLQAYGSMVLDFDQEPWFITSAGNALIINLSAAVQVSGRAYYTQS